MKNLYDVGTVFIGGDFNSVPNSGLYRFLTEYIMDSSIDLHEWSN